MRADSNAGKKGMGMFLITSPERCTMGIKCNQQLCFFYFGKISWSNLTLPITHGFIVNNGNLQYLHKYGHDHVVPSLCWLYFQQSIKQMDTKIFSKNVRLLLGLEYQTIKLIKRFMSLDGTVVWNCLKYLYINRYIYNYQH